MTTDEIDPQDEEQVAALVKTLRETTADLLEKGMRGRSIRAHTYAVEDGEEV